MAGLYGLKILLLWAAIIALVDCQDVPTPKPAVSMTATTVVPSGNTTTPPRPAPTLPALTTISPNPQPNATNTPAVLSVNTSSTTAAPTTSPRPTLTSPALTTNPPNPQPNATNTTATTPPAYTTLPPISPPISAVSTATTKTKVTTQAPPPPTPYCVYDATPNAGGFTIQILENSTHGNYNVEIGNVLMGEFSYPKNSSFEVKNLMPCTTYKHNVIYMGPNGNETSCDRTETTIKTREILKQDIQIVSCQPGSICYKSDWDIPKTAISTSINIPVESCGNEFCVKPRFDDICKTFTTTFKSGDCGKPVNLTQNIPIDFLNPRDIKPDFQNKIPVDIKPKLPPMCDNRTLTVDYTCQNGGLGQTKKPEELEPETDYTCIGQIKTANKTSPFPLRINCSIMIHKRHDAVTNKSISYTWDTKSDNCATIVPDLTYTCNCSEEKDKKNFHSVPVQQVAASGRTCDVAGLKPYTDYTCSIQPVYKTTLIHSGAVKYNERTQFGKPDQIDSLKVNLPEHNVIRVTCSYPTPKSKSFHGPEKIFIAHLNGGKELKSKKCDFEFKDLSYSTSYKLEVFAFNGKLLSNPREQHVTTYYNDKAVIGFLVFLIILTSVALILVVYKIFILRRRRSQDIGENMMLIQTANDEESLMPVDPIAAELLLDAYKRKFADEGRLFLAEFQSIPRIFSRYTVKEAKKQHNTVKNRYVDILPYDYDRVQLTTGNGEAGSDYINASFIDGYKESKKYIAAQGPKEETISDFWRMVWEQQSSIIVMVTRCEEGNRAKCAQYWPSLERETEIYDEFIVKLKSEDKCPDYTIRHLNITNKRDKASEREVTHIQFMSWPDHGVPGEPHLLLKLRRRVNAFKNFFSGPVVVHCSAGVGRTGTYIAIDAMMECLEAEGRLDIYGYVVRLRRQRCLMVQVEAQYILIHQAMLEQIQFGETEVTVSELHSTLNTLRQQSSEDEATLMEDEFERLPTFKNWRTFNTGSMEENKKKNRDSSVVPYDYNRVSLKMDEGRSHESDPSEEDEEDYSDEDDDESSKYINASHIDGYWGPHSFIVAQTPLPDTTEDFWTMVYQNRASTIVMLSDCSQGDEESDCVYWGKDKKTFGDFEVELVSTEVHPTYISRNMLLRHVKRKDSRTLKQFQFLKWGSGEVPENPQDLPDLIKDIKEGQNSERTMSMVVHCNDGSTRSGVFCALWNLLDSAETEKLVDVFQVVKTLRKERLRMLSSLEQYQFLYEALDGVFPVQNGEVKPVQTSQSDSVQVVDETKAAAAAAAERPASTTSSDQQAAPAAAATNTDGGDAGKKEEEVQKPDTATAPADSGDGVTVTVEV